MQEKKIRWKTSLLPLFIYLFFLIFLISCDPIVIPNPPQPSPDLPPVSDKLAARIYFDATLSMQGFVVPDSTRYTQICPYLESVIVSGWDDETVDFFRFGEQVEDIDRDTYLQSGYADFYEDENIYRETFIQKIIDYEDQLASDSITENITPEESTEIESPNTSEESTEAITLPEEVNNDKKEHHLVVIVTDLFQDRGDINRLVVELKEKYIKKGLEVGLFGLRSQFDGMVYDIGIDQEPLSHRSTQDPQTFRPFYLLVLGRHANIAHYFDRLKANGFPEANTIIFSQYLVSPLLSFEDAAIKPPENLNNDTITGNPDPRLKEFRVTTKGEPSKISATLEYVLLPHVMSFDSNTLEAFVVVEHTPIEEIKKGPDPQKCLNVQSTLSKNGDSNELSVEFNLSSSLQNAVYFYEVTLGPGIDSYQAPGWCSNWDMGETRDGSRTLNLVNFVRDLSQVTARMHHPKIARFHCYIKKR